MKVLMVHNRYRSGQPSGENISVDVEARLLSQHGCRVQLLELASDDIARWSVARRLGLAARVVWSREGSRLTESAIQRFRPDVVHFQNTFPLFSPASFWAARRASVPVVHTLRNFRPLCPSGDLLRNHRICQKCVGRLPVPAVIHGCYRDSRLATIPLAAMDALHQSVGTWSRCIDIFITPSEFVRATYLNAGWPHEKFFVKYNTVAEPPRNFHKPRSGFLCVGRLSREKGIDVLLEAWARAFPDGGEGLQIVGSGDQEKQLRRLPRALPAFHFAVNLHAALVTELLGQCRAAIVPSLWHEPFGRAVVEAFSVRTPVIASRMGALPELIADGSNGLLTEAGSPQALASALEIIARSDSLVTRLGRHARASYEMTFNPEATTKRLIGLYTLAIDRSSTFGRKDTRVRMAHR